MAQRFECGGADGHSRLAALGGFYAVVDTPRRTRPSIARAGDDQIAFGDQLFQRIVGNR
jgi:hypothetical protein